MKHIGLFMVIGLLALSACSFETEQNEPESNETSLPTNLTDEFDKVDVQEFVSDWIQQAPTYAYDGQNLDLQEHIVMESYPAQHVLTYTFTSSSAGYGNRSDEVTAQVMTDHVIVVRATDGEITSAVIDDIYNERTQDLVESLKPENDRVTLSFTPEQCEEYVWDQWYADGYIQYVQEPTQEQLIEDYYANNGILADIDRVESDMMTCQACGCPQAYSFSASVEPADVDTLKEHGWN